MKSIVVLITTLALAAFPRQAEADPFLGTANDFAVLAGQSVTNTGGSFIDGGNVGVDPGSSITGLVASNFGAGYTSFASNATTLQAQSDLTAAYSALENLPLSVAVTDLTGTDLGGLTLQPGVYTFSSSAGLTGTVTLDFQGNPDSLFVFLVGSTLITGTGSTVAAINTGSSSETGCTVFWQVGSSATLDTTTTFMGHILALTSITMNDGASIINGSALARNGSVVLNNNSIDNFCLDVAGSGSSGPSGSTPGDTTAFTSAFAPVPEPSTMSLTLMVGLLVVVLGTTKRVRRRRKVAMGPHCDPGECPGAIHHSESESENVMRVKRVFWTVAGTVGLLAMGACATAPKSTQGKADIEQEASAIATKARTSHASLAKQLDASAGYAVFPSVGKGAVGVGGAYGKGVLFEKGSAVGYCDLSQASIGLALGGQSYTEIIVFETRDAVDRFKQGRFRFDAQATAVALKSGVGVHTMFTNGVAVYTMNEAGLMYEASVGGQKFSYQAK